MTSHLPVVRRSAAEQAKYHTAMTELWEQRISFNKLLGLKVLSLEPGDVRVRLDMRPELVGHYSYGRLHGGVISASLVDFLRQGIGSHFIGHAEVTRLGGRIGSTQMRMVNDQGTLIATAAASFVVA